MSCPQEVFVNDHHHSSHKAVDSQISPSSDAKHHQHLEGAKGGHQMSGEHTHNKHEGHSVAMFQRKFWIALALTVPALIWGHMLPNALRYTPPQLPGSHLFPAIFGTIVFLVGGLVFLQGAARELRDRLP